MVQRKSLHARLRQRRNQNVPLDRHLRALKEELVERDVLVLGGEGVDRVGEEGEDGGLVDGVDREVAELTHLGGDVVAQGAEAAGGGPEEERLKVGREAGQIYLERERSRRRISGGVDGASGVATRRTGL